MSIDFDDLVAGPLAEIFGAAARHRRPPYVWTDVRAVRTTPSAQSGLTASTALMVEIRAAELPRGARFGDQVDLGDGIVRTVETADLDDLEISWRLTLSEPAEE